jgi:hypothetical protein
MQLKGSLKAARLRHKHLQALYDAIKIAREEGEAFVTFQGQRLRLFSSAHVVSFPLEPPMGLVKIRGRVRLCEIIEKDGLRARPRNRWEVCRGV